MIGIGLGELVILTVFVIAPGIAVYLFFKKKKK